MWNINICNIVKRNEFWTIRNKRNETKNAERHLNTGEHGMPKSITILSTST